MLSQLILLNGLQTNADRPGSEKLCSTFVEPGWLTSPARSFHAESDLGMADTTLVPEKLFMVKGFNRSVCTLGVLYACFQNSELLEAR